MALTTTISLAASSQSIVYGTQVTLTATVSSTAQVNEGTVTFTSGSATLGSAPVTAGIATLNVSSLAAGTDTLAASYADSAGNFAAAALTPGIITTIAGTGTGGYSGDGGPATAAELNSPYGIALDSAGDIFIADSSNNRIREITAAGAMLTIAGTGTAGFSGDNGPATAATLNFPVGVALDSVGDLFIADQYNNRIREINHLTGVITTVAGSSNFQTGSGGDGGPATAAYLNSAAAVAVDSAGDIYIADDYGRVREVKAVTGTISTIAGNGTSGFTGDNGPATAAELSFPDGLAIDSAGDVFIADSGNNRVREVKPNGVITTVAGGGTNSSNNGDGGPATAANLDLSNNTGLAVDTAGDLFIADVFHGRIREVAAGTGIITTVAGNGGLGFVGNNGPATAANLDFPHDEAFDAGGNLYIDDQGGDRIREVSGGLLVAVSQATPTVRVADAGGTYNGSLFAATATVNSSASLESVTPTLKYYSGTTATGTALTGAPTAAGTYSVVASFAGSADYAAATSGSLTFVISPASLTVTANDAGMVYGGPLPTLGGAIGGEVAGDGITASFSTTATAASHVQAGGYPITGTLSDPNHKLANYTVTYVAAALTVTPAPLTITANSLFMTVGSAVPTLTASYAGFVNGDSPASLTTPPALSTTATSASPASPTPYPITVGGAVDPNYTFTYVAGGLTISNMATPGVTVNDAGGAYNGSGFVATATIDGSASLEGVLPQIMYYPGANSGGTPLAAAPTNAGTYTVVASFAGSTDYNPAQSSPLTLIISPAPLTVTASSLNKVYGAALPTLTGSVSGEVSGDGITASFSTTATAASHVQAGGYPITATLSDPNGKLANYTVTYVSGTLTVTPAPLTLTANNATKAYGAAIPPLSASYMGLVNGDTPASLTTAPTLSTTASSTSAPGPYPITVGGAADLDYSIGYVAGTLTVTGLPTSVSLAASPLTVSFGQTVNLVATVSSSSNVSEGSVAFVLGSTTLGNVPVSGNTASLSISTLPGGTDAITAVYSDSGGLFAGSSSGASTSGQITTVAGNGTLGNTGNNGPATAAELYDPHGIVVDSAGDVFIDDHSNNVVREINHLTGVITIVAGNGTGGFSGDGGPATAAQLNEVEGLAIDSSGNLYICDGLNSRIREVNHATGIITTVAGGGTAGSGDGGPATAAGLEFEKAVAVDSAGDIFIADWADGRVREVNHATGIITTIAGGGSGGLGGPATAASLDYPDGVAVDSAGDVYIADSGRITEINAVTHVITQVATTSGYYNPGAIALDAAGDLFVPDTSNNEVWELNQATGQFSVVFGKGGAGFSGDGGPATAAQFNDPWGVAVDAAGDVYVTDANNHRVREISTGATVVVSPGNLTPPLSVTDNGGPYKGSAYLASVTVNGSASLEGVTPALSYYFGTAASGSPLTTVPSHAGTYTVVASFAGTTDYTSAQSGPATFVISPAALTITANNQTMPLGGPLPTLTASYSGFVGSDSPASLTTLPTLATTATAASTVTGNPYSITVSGAVDPDYSISYVAGQLTVTSAVPPTSSVAALGYRTSNTSIQVSWSGTPGTGGPIESFNIYVSTNNGPFTIWRTDTAATSAFFTATVGSTYGFISQATDAAGNTEAMHNTADTTVTIVAMPWQNPGNPLDVLGQGAVVPADALAIIDYLNLHPGDSSLPANAPVGSDYYDVLGENSVVPADALAVINYLNAHPASPGIQPAVAEPVVATAPAETSLSPAAAADHRLAAVLPAAIAFALDVGPSAAIGKATMPISPAVVAVAAAPASAAGPASPPAVAPSASSPQTSQGDTASGLLRPTARQLATDTLFFNPAANWWDESPWD